MTNFQSFCLEKMFGVSFLKIFSVGVFNFVHYESIIINFKMEKAFMNKEDFQLIILQTLWKKFFVSNWKVW